MIYDIICGILYFILLLIVMILHFVIAITGIFLCCAGIVMASKFQFGESILCLLGAGVLVYVQGYLIKHGWY
jgi:hypothetical protein